MRRGGAIGWLPSMFAENVTSSEKLYVLLARSFVRCFGVKAPQRDNPMWVEIGAGLLLGVALVVRESARAHSYY